jgi:hypothetical protein
LCPNTTSRMPMPRAISRYSILFDIVTFPQP